MPEKPAYNELKQKLEALEKKNADLAAENRKYRRLVENLNDIVYILDRRGVISYISPNVERIAGYRPEELIGRSYADLIGPADSSELEENFRRVLSGEELVTEHPYVTKNRGVVWALSRARPAYDEDGGEITGVQGTLVEITERKQAEEALESDRAFLSAVLDNIAEAIVICDAAGRLVRFNEAARKIHGLPESPVPPAKWAEHYDLYQADGKTPLPVEEIPLYRALQGERVVNQEIVIAPRGRKPHSLVCSGQALEDDAGGKIGAVVAMHDITERRNAEALFLESEKRFQRMLDMVPDMISIHSPQMDILYSNWSGFAAVPEERRVLPAKCYSTYRGFSDVCPDCRAISVLESGRPFQEEVGLPGGTWVDLRVIPILDKNNNVEMFMEWVRDITERKRVEQELRESEQFSRHVLHSLASGLYIYNLQKKRNDFITPQYTVLTGWTLDDINQMGENFQELFHPEDRPRVKNHMEKLMHAAEGEILELEYRFLTKDERWIWCISRDTAFERDENGRVNRFMGSFFDITKHKEAEETSAKLLEQFHQAQKMESIGRLAGGVAHDLNNLLSPVLGYGEMLLEDTGGNDPRRGSLEEIVGAGKRAQNLVRQLLAFSRKQSLQFQAVRINDLLKEFRKLLRRTLREDIKIQTRLARALPQVRGDIGQLEQVVMNLAVNAQDAMPQGGTLTIETAKVYLDEAYAREKREVTPGPYVMIGVSDTGCGMDAETFSHLFEPFFTTKEKGKGTGLGLATSYGIVKQHGGSIWAYSEPGRGTTIKIYLPIPSDPVEPDPTPVQKQAARGARGAETIILAEDDEQVRNLAEIVLKRHGYQVLAAGSGEALLSRLSSYEEPVHLLLTDVIMPDMNGKELLGRVCELHPDVRVLYMSGYTDNVIAHHGVIDAGIHFIEKPFTVQALAAKVREVLDQ
jgi:PAS domain S-box-containing protein